MIVRDRPSVWQLFYVLRGSLLPRIWPQIAGVGILSLVIVAAHKLAPHLVPSMSAAPFALLGIAISVFLSFRNSASHDRWWEARKLWGQIIQTARDIARQTAHLDAEARCPARRAILQSVIGFAADTARQLRTPATAIPNSADAQLTEAALVVARLSRDDRLTLVETHALTESLTRLSHALVGCERLANTPLPFAYTLLLHRTAYLFCFMMPFGFADNLGWVTPLATMLVAYTFFGLDALGDELEEPFGLDQNDLPIAAYATIVEITLRAALGETDLPPLPQPVDYVLR